MSDTTSNNPTIPGCRACGVTVRLPQREVERLVAEYFHARSVVKVSEDVYAKRLELCVGCPNLAYGTTCRKCGCLVAVRAWIAEKGCPDRSDRWSGCCDPAEFADTSVARPPVDVASSNTASKD